MAYSRPKYYADNKKRYIEFYIGYWIYLKILPMKGVIMFGNNGKLSTQYVGPYKIFKRVEEVEY